MPKQNYNFEKRQRELAKKKKQDEKLARKREARAGSEPATDESPLNSGSSASPAP